MNATHTEKGKKYWHSPTEAHLDPAQFVWSSWLLIPCKCERERGRKRVRERESRSSLSAIILYILQTCISYIISRWIYTCTHHSHHSRASLSSIASRFPLVTIRNLLICAHRYRLVFAVVKVWGWLGTYMGQRTVNSVRRIAYGVYTYHVCNISQNPFG